MTLFERDEYLLIKYHIIIIIVLYSILSNLIIAIFNCPMCSLPLYIPLNSHVFLCTSFIFPCTCLSHHYCQHTKYDGRSYFQLFVSPQGRGRGRKEVTQSLVSGPYGVGVGGIPVSGPTSLRRRGGKEYPGQELGIPHPLPWSRLEYLPAATPLLHPTPTLPLSSPTEDSLCRGWYTFCGFPAGGLSCFVRLMLNCISLFPCTFWLLRTTVINQTD